MEIISFFGTLLPMVTVDSGTLIQPETPVMSRKFAVHLRYRLLWAGIVLIPFCCGISSAQEIDATGQQLYLLSATPTEHSDKTYPANLYQVGADKKLKLVREVVPQSDGVRFVQAWGSTIFVVQPHVVATTISIVHTGEPARRDDVLFNSGGLYVNDSAAASAEPQTGTVELLPLLEDYTDPAHLRGTLASVSTSPAGSGPRVKFDFWGQYSFLRRAGDHGGPSFAADLIASREGGKLAISIYGHTVFIDSLPSALRGATRKIIPIIVAATQEYLILMVQRTREEMLSPDLGNSREIFVHERLRDRWKTLRIEGNSPTLGLFSPWLATIVGMWNPDHKPSPGRENERNQATDQLPNVQEEYATYGGRWILRPGILVLQNLADGRKIRIETGQEDSEILQVEADTVLYRVNDAIYQARIAGDQLRDSTVVVKDEDVPEVHWVFWAK
jgi:hypothetical protein